MYTYCLNNPSNYRDDNGVDAVWIQEAERVYGNGHSGLLVDNGTGEWYFLYWGASGDGSLLQKCIGTDYHYVFVKVDVSDYDLHTTEGVIHALHDSGNATAKMRGNFVTGTYYLEGDYSATYDYLAKMKAQESVAPGSLGKYSMITRNCATMTWEALACSNGRFIQNTCPIIPNRAFQQIQMLDEMDNFIYKLWHDFQLY